MDRAERGLASRPAAKTKPVKKSREKVLEDGTVFGRPDIALLAVTGLLVLLGLAFVLSSSSYTSSISGDALAEFRGQLVWAGVGAAGMTVAALIDYRKLMNGKFVLVVLGGTILLLALIFVLPRTSGPLRAPKINGAQRWIRIMAGERSLLSIQPSEIAKFALILFLAVKLSLRPKDLNSFTKSVVPCMGVAGVLFVLIILQPNLSTAGTIMIVAIAMMFIAGCKIKHLVMPVLALIPAAIALVVLEPYRLSRYLSFRDPWSMADKESYQLVQSLYGLANGGLFGTGFGMSRQKYSFLPYASSDFIFSIVGEEVGFVGSALILALFFVLIYLGLRVAMNCPNRFGSLMAAGLTTLLAVQVIINVAVVTGSMPTTGLPLPFFTSGGTSLAIFMTEMGVLLSISRHRRATSVST